MHTFYDSIADFIFCQDQPAKADVIFVPGSNQREIAENAARLYKEGWAPYVLPSGRYAKAVGSFPGQQKSEWQFLREVLLENGVPESAILKEDKATFTWENAKFSKQVLEQAGITVNQAILSCQAFHTRRSLLYYQSVFTETQFLVCPVSTKGITKENWYLTQEGTDQVLGEVERIGQQFHCMLPVGAPDGHHRWKD